MSGPSCAPCRRVDLLELIEGPTGPLEVLVNGEGAPTTLFAHGLGGSIAETRPFGSGVIGTRVFLHFRGHGRSSAPGLPFSYADLADELMVVQESNGATQYLSIRYDAVLSLK